MLASLEQITQKEMTRQEFLIAMGLAVVSIFGFGHIVEIFTGRSLHKNLSAAPAKTSSGHYGL